MQNFDVLTSETGMHLRITVIRKLCYKKKKKEKKRKLCYSLTGNIIFLLIQKVMECLEINVIIGWMKYGISRESMHLNMIEIQYRGSMYSG